MFTLWRNTEVGVLVDIAYPLNTATRIASGEVPYAQFPLAHAPLHFLVQALLIRLFGPHFMVQIAYATLLSGTSAVLTFLIARRLMCGVVGADLVAGALGLALVPLGIYSIYPHPFYDPDACLAVLIAIWAVLAAIDAPSARRWILAGALLTVPIWVKQNIGGAFLVSMLAVLLVDAVLHRAARRQLVWTAWGVAVALGAELLVLQAAIGIDAYLRWTWTFALAGRGVSADRVAAFADPRVLWPALLILIPAAAAPRLPVRARGPTFVAALCVPLAVVAAVPDAELAVPQLFPPLLIAAIALALWRSARGPRSEWLLPIALAATTLGAVQSQGLPNSTFGIYSLLMLAIASLVGALAVLVRTPARLAPMVGGVLALVILIGGADYTLTNKGLRFIDVNAPGPVVRSTFPSLLGLSARGPYIEDLDAILRWTAANVRDDEGMVFLPGEDPVFFALARRPALPSVYFYDIATPYSPSEIAQKADDVGLRWVIVKDRLQTTVEPPLEQALIASLTRNAELVTRVPGYRVYRRR